MALTKDKEIDLIKSYGLGFGVYHSLILLKLTMDFQNRKILSSTSVLLAQVTTWQWILLLAILY